MRHKTVSMKNGKDSLHPDTKLHTFTLKWVNANYNHYPLLQQRVCWNIRHQVGECPPPHLDLICTKREAAIYFYLYEITNEHDCRKK